MSKADLHCHSIYSEHPSDWFLQRLGAKESYTNPITVYHAALDAGMDFVTITDHNKIDGVYLLKDKFPGKVITGVESTTYFPEDNCKIHILIYGLDDIQFEVINHVRKDIYELRDYLKQENLAHSVAHASYSINGKLNQTHLEKLILLFDHFEAINGGRSKHNNLSWNNLLQQLNPDIIQKLYNLYRIEPMSENAWIKGFTGGSDDHGALFIGNTWTSAKAITGEDFLRKIREKESLAEGRHNSYHALAFTVYKIAWDFSRQKTGTRKDTIISKLTEHIFDNRGLELKDRIRLRSMKSMADIKGDTLKRSMSDLIETLKPMPSVTTDQRLDLIYSKISQLADAYFMVFLDSLEDDIKEMNLIKLVRNISSSLPGIFLLLPFFSSLKHIHQNRTLLSEMRMSLEIESEPRKQRILWFTDTLNDLNGVSVTIKRMGQVAFEEGRETMIVASLDDDQITDEIPQNLMNLPYMYRFPLPFYENYRIKVPSILNSIKMIQDYEPDKIIISTPGPLGLLALLAAKIMQIECIGIYHTDFTYEAEHIIEDESARNMILSFEHWFYNQMDEIRVPTHEYEHILKQRGIHADRMQLLKRGIETELFRPFENRKALLPAKLLNRNGVTLLYAGRVSKDKSLELLAHVYLNLLQKYPDLNLIIAGNGPFLKELKEILTGTNNIVLTGSNVVFTGAVSRNSLPNLYNAADYFIFPSVTDTFGMVILESQACGLPAVVSNQGGPKEIISPSMTGFVAADQKKESWVKIVEHCIDLYKNHQKTYLEMRRASRETAMLNGNWSGVISDLLGDVMI